MFIWYDIIEILLNGIDQQWKYIKTDPNIKTQAGQSIIPAIIMNINDKYLQEDIIILLLEHGADHYRLWGRPILELPFISDDMRDFILNEYNEIHDNKLFTYLTSLSRVGENANNQMILIVW